MLEGNAEGKIRLRTRIMDNDHLSQGQNGVDLDG
jgi:hypothetical protein